MFTPITSQRLLSQTMMIRLIKANQKAGRNVNVRDNCTTESMYAIQGGVRLGQNEQYKMAIGPDRLYVADVNTMVNQGQLSIIVSK